MIRALKVWWFKRKAKQAFLRWLRVNDDLDCGNHMAAMVRPLAAQHAANQALFFDIYIDKLRAIGEPVPSYRLSAQGATVDE